MRILFVTQTYPRFPEDTAGPFIRDLARALVAGGDEVTVLAPHAAGLPAGWQDGGPRVVTFRYAPEACERVGYGRSLERDESVRGAAAAVVPLYAAGLARALGRELAPGAYDLVHAHWVVPNGLLAAPFARRVPLAIGLHGSDVFLAERPGVRAVVRAALARCRLLTGCSPELVARVAALGRPAAQAVIPYGVDTAAFSPDPERRQAWRRRLKIPPEAPVLLAVGRMVTKKGFHVLAEVLPSLLARHGDLHAVLAGGGDRLAELQSALAGQVRVHWPGSVLRDALPDLYRAADLFVLPAVHDGRGNVDGLPNVILEAMASGLPVVAAGISGIPLAVGDGSEGRLVAEGDREALAAAIGELLAAPARRRAMGEAARRRAATELTWGAVAARYRVAYAAALAA